MYDVQSTQVLCIFSSGKHDTVKTEVNITHHSGRFVICIANYRIIVQRTYTYAYLLLNLCEDKKERKK